MVALNIAVGHVTNNNSPFKYSANVTASLPLQKRLFNNDLGG